MMGVPLTRIVSEVEAETCRLNRFGLFVALFGTQTSNRISRCGSRKRFKRNMGLNGPGMLSVGYSTSLYAPDM